MQLDGGGARVGRKRDAPQRRFPLPLAFVAVLFYIVFGAGQWEFGATLVADFSAELRCCAKADQSAVRPMGVTCRTFGQSAAADANGGPEIIHRSAVVRDARPVSAIVACLDALNMEQAGESPVRLASYNQ